MTTPNEHTLTQEVALSRRRLMGHVLLGTAAALGLAACGGGSDGSDSDSSVDLRAAYDRVDGGMNHEEVEAAVGIPFTSGSDLSQYWEVGTQRLSVAYAVLSNGDFFVNSVLWNTPGSSLDKSFDPNTY